MNVIKTDMIEIETSAGLRVRLIVDNGNALRIVADKGIVANDIKSELDRKIVSSMIESNNENYTKGFVSIGTWGYPQD